MSASTTKCPDCKSENISYYHYDLTCCKCGLVIEESYIDNDLSMQPYDYMNQVEIETNDTILEKDVEEALAEVRNVISSYIYEDFNSHFYTLFRKVFHKTNAHKPVKGKHRFIRLLAIFARLQRKISYHNILAIAQYAFHKQVTITDKEFLEEAKHVWEACSQDKHLKKYILEFKQPKSASNNIQSYLRKLPFDKDKKKDIVQVYDKMRARLPTKLVVRDDVLDWTLIYMASRYLKTPIQLKEYERICGLTNATIIKTEKHLKELLTTAS